MQRKSVTLLLEDKYSKYFPSSPSNGIPFNIQCKGQVVPIYGRGGGTSDPRKKTQDDYGGNGQNAGQLLDIPGRPPGVRNPVNDVRPCFGGASSDCLGVGLLSATANVGAFMALSCMYRVSKK